MSTNDDEEEEDTTTNWRNAFWAKVREGDRGGFSSDFRGVNQGPHGGQQRVRPEDIIGDYNTCWCGQPADHDWPGKASGRKHPKEQRMSATEPAETEIPHITRNELDGFSDSYKEIILKAVNDYRIRYRKSNRGIMLYPHDPGVSPLSLPMRENNRTLKSAKLWFVRHVADPETEARMAKLRKTESIEDAARVLAAELNDPVEHPAKPEAPVQAGPAVTRGVCANCGMETRTVNDVTKHRLTNKVECVEVPEGKEGKMVAEPVAEATSGRMGGQAPPEVESERLAEIMNLYNRLDGEGLILPLTEGRTIWHPQTTSYENPLYEVEVTPHSGTWICCRVKDCTFRTNSGKGASGHMIKHDPEGRGQKMWGAEAQAKKKETRQHTVVTDHVTAAIALLNKAIGIEAPKEPTKTEQKALAKAIAERDKAREDADKMAAARDDWKVKYEDLKAKLDLLRDL